MISIIDYGAGNLKSVARAFGYLGIRCRITAKPREILSSDKVVFPGVGAAASAMQTITSRGLDSVIKEAVYLKKPFLGICLGAQIVLDSSEEDRGVPCLGILPGAALRFRNSHLKVPHMGWNSIAVLRPHPVLAGIDRKDQFYFVHSYYAACAISSDVIAVTAYGIEFSSIIGRDNVIAVQFHIEKSGPAGLRLLKNFSEWNGVVEPC
ncbi:MAG: imidazole glycerol phosphate synthase subunit HisH [Syntrophales bacterium]|jgi:glutamine amidotransferase|nr:imidazole glycerol phosphate synthase subunit HisH [Syntrophales bacterium]MDY0044203.1 imidazole glycerol phosphate synthase subunit HisH [Syntrophales bacterium]